MHIQKIEIENYGPFYGRHEFRFRDRGLTLIMGDNQDEPRMNSNGSGKSSILDGLDFSMFGEVPRGDHVDSVINDESKKCSVCTYIIDDLNRTVIIKRTRAKTTTLELIVDGEHKESLDIKETQKDIETILGVDRDVFHAAVLFAQTDLKHYAESTDSERMNILTKILQLEEIDRYLDSAKDAEKKSRDMLGSIAAKIEAQRQVLAGIEAKNFEDNISNFETDRRNRIASIQQLREANFNERKKCSQVSGGSSGLIQEQILQLRADLANLPKPDETALRECQNRQKETDVELAGLVNEYKAKADELLGWKSKGVGVCSQCGQMVTAELLFVEIQKRENELAILQTELTAKNTELAGIADVSTHEQNRYNQATAGYQADIQKRNYEIGVLEQRVFEAQEKAKRLETLELEGRRLDGLNLEVANEVNPWVLQREENAQAHKKTWLEIEALTAQRAAIVENAEYISFWLKAFGSKGLKSYILDARLQELTDAVNQWVSLLTGGTIWVQFSSQKKTRSKKLVNSPTIRVCRWNPDGTTTERNFNSWSGGEKQRISFAIDFGLSRLIARRAKKTYNLLILDEVFRHLDQGGKEAVVEMLQLLAREKESVFVVEHDTDFQAAFENRILVQKKNGRSVIKELDYAENENEAESAGASLQDKSTKDSPLRVVPVSRRAVRRTPL